MGARGRRGLIIGLEDLAKGVVLATEMKRRAAADALEREKFEASKAEAAERSRVLDEYYQGLLGNKRSELSAAARKAAEAQRAKLSESIQRGRVTKNLESGNLTRAARIAYNRFGETIPGTTLDLFKPPDAEKELTPLAEERMAKNLGMSLKDYIEWRAGLGGSGGGGASDLDKARQVRANVATIAGEIAAEKPKSLSLEGVLRQNRFLPTDESDYAGPSAKRFEPEATKYVPGAGDLPMPAASDAYESMSSEDWDDVVQAAVEDALGHPMTPEEASDPLVTTLRVTDPRHRKQILAGIPKMFLYTRPK